MEQLPSLSDSPSFARWLEVAPWPIHLVDQRGIPCGSNPELASLLGYGADEMDRSAWSRCMPPATRRLVADARQVLPDDRRGNFCELPLTYHHRDGTKVVVRRARLGPLHPDHKLLPVMLVDVAPTPMLDRADVQARFARLINHDFNNIFTIARSYLHLASNHESSPEMADDYLDRAAKAIARGIELNDQLQTIVNGLDLPLEATQLEQVIGGLRSFLPRLLSPGPQWSLHCEPDLPPLLSHPIRLARFITDLCLNAHLRWPQSSTLTLEVRRAPSRQRSVIARVRTAKGVAPAHSMNFRRFLCRPDLSGPDATDPLFIYGVVHGRPVSIDLCDDTMVALIPAIQH